MVTIVWISAENDEWTLFNVVRLNNRTPARRVQPNDSKKIQAVIRAYVD